MSQLFHHALHTNLNADAYLQWAFQTGFRYFNFGRQTTVVLLVEFAPGKPVSLHNPAWRSTIDGVGLQISDWYDGYHYAAVAASATALPVQLAALQGLGATCFELADPAGIVPVSFNNAVIASTAAAPGTVLGIIDDGCPFAHWHFRGTIPDAPAVRFVWDQGMLFPGTWGTPLPYGVALLQSDLQAIVLKATSASGAVDEDSAYRLSGLPSLCGATSHGAQVMSHATGHARDSAPVSMLQRSDIAFVQLPSDALDDPSGNWLEHYALDGIHAVRSYAEKGFASPAPRVVINLSYGRQTGPHDGTSHFEKAIDEITTQAAAVGYFLKVVVPSGNSHHQRAHAEFDLAQRGGVIDWCVAPDSQLPSYLEIWLPTGTSMATLDVSLESPSGEKIPPGQESDDGTAWVSALPVCGNPAKTLILMVVTPTARAPESAAAISPAPPLAVSGRWKVKVAVPPTKTATGVAHAYLAIKDPNMGRGRRGRTGYLDSPGYDPKRYLEESDQLIENPNQVRAEVVACGSMSGIATAATVGVAAGYVVKSEVPSLYSSGGPGRAGRVGPDWAYPTDESVVQRGLLAGGNRTGTVMRLLGTSFAAPQFARELLVTPASPPNPPNLAAPTPPSPTPPPPPPPSWFPHRAGGGMR